MIDVKISFTKRLTLPTDKAEELAAIGARAFEMIRDRITGPNVDADGTPLPPLALRRYAERADGRRPEPRPRYAELKIRRGLEGKRDGLWTGAMWKAGNVVVTTLKGVHQVKVGFRGSTKNPSGTRIANRLKARQLQYLEFDEHHRYEGAPAFLLMRLSAEEMAELGREAVARIHWED